VYRFLTKILHAFFIPLMCAICPAHPILFYLITVTVFCEAYKFGSSSLCSLLKSPATSSLIGPNVLPSGQSQWPQQLKACTVFNCSNTGIIDLNPAQGMCVCVCFFLCCAALCR
jgi:hypothetical protein